MSVSPALYVPCKSCGAHWRDVIQPVETGRFYSCRSWGHPSSPSDVWASLQAERWRFSRLAFNVPQYLYVPHFFPGTQKFQNYTIFPISSPPFCTWRVSAVCPLYHVVILSVDYLQYILQVYTWGEFTCKKRFRNPYFLDQGGVGSSLRNSQTCQLAKEDLSFFFFSGLQWNFLFWPPIFFPEKLALFDEKPVNDSLRGWPNSSEWWLSTIISEAMQNTFMWEHWQPSVLPHQTISVIADKLFYRGELSKLAPSSSCCFSRRFPAVNTSS